MVGGLGQWVSPDILRNCKMILWHIGQIILESSFLHIP